MQLTQSPESEHSPGLEPGWPLSSPFSPAAARRRGPDALWLLDRGGGDARQVTHFKGDVLDYDWSPDGRQLALVVLDDPLPGADDEAEGKTPPPIVIDRFYFKEDETGYLSSRQMHLYRARRGHRQDRSAHLRPLQRKLSRLVAGWLAARIREQARRRPGPRQHLRSLCDGSDSPERQRGWSPRSSARLGIRSG